MCTQRKMSSTTQSILLLVLNSVSLSSAQTDWDSIINGDVSKILGHATQVKNSISFREDESWQLSNGQIFVILVTFFIVVFLIILCCAARRKRKPQERDVMPQPAPAPYQPPGLCPSCHNTIHSMSQLTVAEDPYPPTYDSIYSTAQSRAMFLNHDQNRHHNGPPPSAPPVTDLH